VQIRALRRQVCIIFVVVGLLQLCVIHRAKESCNVLPFIGFPVHYAPKGGRYAKIKTT
jgi:hypothetical protein